MRPLIRSGASRLIMGKVHRKIASVPCHKLPFFFILLLRGNRVTLSSGQIPGLADIRQEGIVKPIQLEE